MPASEKRLYFVETPAQVEIAIATIGRQKRSATILSLTTQAEYTLETLGMRCKRLSDYASDFDLDNLGAEQLGVVDELTKLIDEIIFSEVEAFRSRNLRPGSLFWYHLKNLLNSVSVRAFILARALREERPDSVVYFETPEEPYSLTLQFVQESPWPAAVQAVCRSLDLPLHAIKDDQAERANERGLPGSGPGGSIKGEFFKIARMLGGRRVLQTARSFRYDRAPIIEALRIRGSLRSRKRPPTIVVLSSYYSLGQVIEQVRATREFRVLHLNVRSPWNMRWLVPFRLETSLGTSVEIPVTLDAQFANAWHRLTNSEAVGRLMTVADIPVFEILRGRLSHFFSFVLKDMFRTYLHTEEVIREIRPSVMVGSTMLYPEKVAFEAARAHGIPTGVYRHGASGGSVLMETGSFTNYYQNDMRWSDFLLTFGDGDTKYFNKHHRNGSRFISVGSADLDRLRRSAPSLRQKSKQLRRLGLDPERPRVFYVPTDPVRNTWVVPSRHRLPSSDFQVGRAIADVFAEFPDIECGFKLHPADLDSPIIKYIEDRGYSNCKVLKGPFRDMVHLADAFVVDYQSTVLLEMLTTDRPILFCGHELPVKFNPDKWHPSILPMWQERIMYAEDLERFLEMLRAFLREGRFESVKSSNEMLRLFGTHLDDGKSAERAVTALKKIVSSRAEGTFA